MTMLLSEQQQRQEEEQQQSLGGTEEEVEQGPRTGSASQPQQITFATPEAQTSQAPSRAGLGASASSPNGGTRRNPPARNTSRFWFERFLAVIQRQNPSVIDSSFLSQIAPSNEGKLLAQLKFLRVIDEQGKPTQLLPALNLIGEEQKKGFQEIVQGSYGDLLSELKIERAVPDDVVNFFIRRHSFTRDKAINAAKFFLYLAEKGSLAVSQELSSFYSEKTPGTASSSNSLSHNSSSISNVSTISRGSEITGRAAAQRIAMAQSTQLRGGNRSLRRLGARSVSLDLEASQPKIQATIEIKLDKDTPREYWDRVLALLGESSGGNGNAGADAEGSSQPVAEDAEKQGQA